MNVLDARNVNDALHKALVRLATKGRPVESRGLSTLELFGPTTTVFRHPQERALIYPGRQPNPWLHLFEAMWLLAGRRDVAFLSQFVPRVKQFSDDGKTFHGAYGYRLRTAGGLDQLATVIGVLKEKPDTRQAVLQIWSAKLDLAVATNDIPCNCLVFLKIRDGKLNMTVCNRSNDAIWGAYGTDSVQFSFLQEYIATNVGVGVGYYWQMSDSLHVYTTGDGGQVYDRLRKKLVEVPIDPYATGAIRPMTLIDNVERFNEELREFFRRSHKNEDLAITDFSEPFIAWTLIPAYGAWKRLKAGRRDDALTLISLIKSTDWRMAFLTYLDEKHVMDELKTYQEEKNND